MDYVGGKEGLLMAPAYAVPAMLKDAGLTLQDFDFYEIHEAFAAQVLCTLAAWESPEYCKERLGLDRPLGSIDRAKLNVNGSSVAMGHPFAATGTRIVSSLAKILASDSGAKRGLYGPGEFLNTNKKRFASLHVERQHLSAHVTSPFEITSVVCAFSDQ